MATASLTVWRLRWFGTINNYLSLSNACPSGDGVNNWKKYVAGVDPNVANDFPSANPRPHFRQVPPPPSTGRQSSASHMSLNFQQPVLRQPWTAIATNTGTGTDMEFDDNSTRSMKFYRVRILP